jgi:TniQ
VSGRFLIRPKPLAGESMSSWRQRSGWQNGFMLFPCPDGRHRKGDWDLCPGTEELLWLASSFDVDSHALSAMSLLGQSHLVSVKDVQSKLPPWWLRAAYSPGSGSRLGPMYCPSCLRDDAEPYLRLHWRFAFVSRCGAHGEILWNDCPHCGSPIWPGGHKSLERVSPQFRSFRQCWQCHGDICQRKSKPIPPDATDELLAWCRHGTFRLDDTVVSSVEAFQALHSVARLFLRSPTRLTIQRSRSRWADVVSAGVDAPVRHVERLGVDARSKLVTAARSVLAAWPRSFVEFAQETGLSRGHWNGMYDRLPSWMNEVLATELAQQNRTVNAERLRTAFSQWEMAHGNPPTRKQLKAMLRWGGRAGLDVVFPPKRRLATLEEWLSFLQRASVELYTRRSSVQTRYPYAFALGVLLYCALTSSQMHVALKLSRDELIHRLRTRSWSAPVSTANLVGLAIADLQWAAERAGPDGDRDRAARRFVQNVLADLMNQLPDDLARDMGVFFAVAYRDISASTE